MDFPYPGTQDPSLRWPHHRPQCYLHPTSQRGKREWRMHICFKTLAWKWLLLILCRKELIIWPVLDARGVEKYSSCLGSPFPSLYSFFYVIILIFLSAALTCTALSTGLFLLFFKFVSSCILLPLVCWWTLCHIFSVFIFFSFKISVCLHFLYLLKFLLCSYVVLLNLASIVT